MVVARYGNRFADLAQRPREPQRRTDTIAIRRDVRGNENFVVLLDQVNHLLKGDGNAHVFTTTHR